MSTGSLQKSVGFLDDSKDKEIKSSKMQSDCHSYQHLCTIKSLDNVLPQISNTLVLELVVEVSTCGNWRGLLYFLNLHTYCFMYNQKTN